jgi:outer membrane protein TolC
MQRASVNSPQILTANINALLAREDSVQARAALLPSVNTINQIIYTQSHDGAVIFVSNDGPRVYNNQIMVHGDIFAPQKLADWRRSQAIAAVARFKSEIAVRSGEVAHSDVVKSEIQFVQRQRDTQEAQLAPDKARIGFAVVLFPDYHQEFTVVDDLDTARPLLSYSEIQSLAGRNSPDIRAAQATVEAQKLEIRASRAAALPSLSFDYFYGMNSTYFALHTPDGRLNLGSVAQAQLTFPLWTWGAARSRVRQSELRLQQAKNDLSLTQRQLLANLDSFYPEAEAANFQVASRRDSMELAAESLRLTPLRYQAGEVTVLEVVDAQTNLVQARNAYDDGVVRYRLALANVQTITGAF